MAAKVNATTATLRHTHTCLAHPTLSYPPVAAELLHGANNVLLWVSISFPSRGVQREASVKRVVIYVQYTYS